MIAVITADLIQSSAYEEELLAKVIEALKAEFKDIEKDSQLVDNNFRIYRGDSFQGVISRPGSSLQVALQLKAAVNRIHLKETDAGRATSKESDLRLAIGIGQSGYEGEEVTESNGEAFQLSGKTLDEMKNDLRKTRLKTPNEEINAEFEASLFLLDMLIDKWSIASAEVVYFLLKEKKEAEIAEILGISQSAVNQRKKAAGWEAISVLLKRFSNAINKRFTDE